MNVWDSHPHKLPSRVLSMAPKLPSFVLVVSWTLDALRSAGSAGRSAGCYLSGRRSGGRARVPSSIRWAHDRRLDMIYPRPPLSAPRSPRDSRPDLLDFQHRRGSWLSFLPENSIGSAREGTSKGMR